MFDNLIRLSERAADRCSDSSYLGPEGRTFLELLFEQMACYEQECMYDRECLLSGLLERQTDLLDLWFMIGDHFSNYAYSQAFVGQLVFVAPGYVFLSAEERFDSWFNNMLPFTVMSPRLKYLFQGRVRREWFSGAYWYVLENFSGFIFPLFPVQMWGARIRKTSVQTDILRHIDVHSMQYCLGVEPCCWAYVETKLARYLA